MHVNPSYAYDMHMGFRVLGVKSQKVHSLIMPIHLSPFPPPSLVRNSGAHVDSSRGRTNQDVFVSRLSVRKKH
jgi:hypothetical protein